MSISLARTLRQTTTLPEVTLWQHLRNRRFIGLKFRRQYPIGSYIVDFVCLEQKLIIELDGRQHLDQIIYDNKRTEYLEHYGFRVIRFWNHDLLAQFELVLEQIHQCIRI
jgi:very-short-patch-repair endonuclease